MKSDSSPVSVIDVNSERMFRDAISLEFVLDSVQGEELGGREPLFSVDKLNRNAGECFFYSVEG